MGPLAIGWFVLGLGLAGAALANRLWRHESCSTREWVASVGLLGLALWTALNWLLSAFGQLKAAPLLAAGTALGLAGLLTRPWREARWSRPSLWLLPVGAWCLLMGWRGFVIPVQNADANSYHLPKAVLMMQAGGYGYFPAYDVRLAAFPCDYELMLADLLILDGTDRWTILPSLLAYGLCTLLVGVILARWWGEGPAILGAMLVFAGAPVVLLGCGHQKNDLLCTVCFLMMFWGAARWCAEGGRAPLVLTCVAAALALGTKVTGVFVLASVLPFVFAVMLRRRQNPLPWLAFLAVCAALLGSAVYLNNILHTGRPLPFPPGNAYGQLENLYLFPALMLMAPFSSSPIEVWVPWRWESWLWPRYEVFNSHCGALFTLLALLAPAGVWTWRRLGNSRECAFGSAMMAVAWVLTVLTRSEPLGMFTGYVRYTLWAIPLVLGWTLVPALTGASRGRSAAALAALVAIFAWQAYDCARHDSYAPWKFVKFCLEYPTARITAAPVRAATQVDALAGRHDTVAIDQGNLDTWMYPAWGRHFERKVILLPPGPGPVVIPPEVDWVAIDRPWTKTWGHPDFKNCGQYQRYLYEGTPSEDDLRVYRALSQDPAFELVKEGPAPVNWVFRRRR